MMDKQPILAKAVPFDCSNSEGNKKTKWKGVQGEEGKRRERAQYTHSQVTIIQYAICTGKLS